MERSTKQFFVISILSVVFFQPLLVRAQSSNNCDQTNRKFEQVPASVKRTFFKQERAAHVLADPAYFIWGMAVIKWDDGKYHGYYARWPKKLGFQAWLTDCEIAHAVSDKPEGPFTFQQKPVYDKVQTEDAGIWYDHQSKMFYMTCHVMGRPDLALFSSPDGYDWTICDRLFSKKEIKLDDGSVWKPQRVERPFILTDDKGKPICLYVGVKEGDCSGNIAIPIK